MDYLGLGLLLPDLGFHQVHQELEAVGPEAGDDLEIGVPYEVLDLVSGISFLGARAYHETRIGSQG